MLKCTVNKFQIVNVLSKIQGLTGRRSNLSITETVLIRTTPDGIQMTATDLETGFDGFYPASVQSDGAIAVNSKKLYEILKEFPLDEILIHEVENRWVEIGEGKILYHIMGMNPEDFPETPEISEIDFFTIDATALQKMIYRSIVVAAPNDEKRPHVLGVLMERIPLETGVCLRFVVTDISRLNIVEYLFDKPDAVPPVGKAILAPKKGLAEVVKFLDTEGPVQIGITERNLIIRKNFETLIVQLLEGEFPKYQGLLETRDAHQIQMDKKQFGKLLKRMSILATDEYNSAVFSFNNNKLTVSAVNPTYGESKEDMDIDFSGDLIQVAFNPKFFMDVLNLIDDENIIFDIVDGSHACILKGDEDHTFTSFIMPMRI